MVKLSAAGKMPCKSWSLQAIDTCPGSLRADGTLVDACAGCYAVGGNYRFPAVRAVREFNRTDWTRDTWVPDMVTAIGSDPWFRWFDSGDCYDIRLARKILAIIEDTPDCRHWIPSRMHKFKKFRDVFNVINGYSNAVVRYSSDSVQGKRTRGRYTSTIASDPAQYPQGATVCEAYTRGGKCSDCRACWDRDVKTVVYPAHGKSMAKVTARLAGIPIKVA